jgi:hypothetical protein
MANYDLLARLTRLLGKHEVEKYLSQYDPPSRGDILHDGLVGIGKTWGGILGTAAGIIGGEPVAGPFGGAAGGFTLGLAGERAGAWGGHGAYLGGQLVNNILSHPENWTVDAAGAIVPATDNSAASLPQEMPSASNESKAKQSMTPPVQTGAPSSPHAPTAPRPNAMGLFGALSALPYPQPEGGLFGRNWEHLRGTSAYDQLMGRDSVADADNADAGGPPAWLGSVAGVDPKDPFQPTPPVDPSTIRRLVRVPVE